MTIEAATYINDLQPVNPSSTDPVSQGDDHLRLIKQVLQNSIVGSSRQWQVPGIVNVTASTTLVKANGESMIFVSTAGGAVTITLPTLTALDVGWSCSIFKYTTDLNPIYIAPPASITLTSGYYTVAKARRCIPGVTTKVTWNGVSNYIANRVTALPIGALIDYWGSGLPAGYEWPNGQTLVSGNYPEYFAQYGGYGTPDLRGYVGVTLDNLGGTAAGHLPTTYIPSTTLGAIGGVDHAALLAGNIPNLSVSGSCNVTSVTTNTPNGWNYPLSQGGLWSVAATSGSGFYNCAWTESGGSNIAISYASSMTGTGSGTISGTATGSGGGTGVAFGILQPSIMLGKIMVVE